VLALAVGCSKDKSVTPPSTDPVDPAEVNKFVNALPDWQIPSDIEEPPVDLGEEEDFEGSQYYRCVAVEYDLKRNFDSIIAVGASKCAQTGMILQEPGSGRLALHHRPQAFPFRSRQPRPQGPSRGGKSNGATIPDAIASLQRGADDPCDLGVVPPSTSGGVRLLRPAGAHLGRFSINTASSPALDGWFALIHHETTASWSSSCSRWSATTEPAGISLAIWWKRTSGSSEEGTMGRESPCYVQSVTYGA
jgi:hypothetical protein